MEPNKKQPPAAVATPGANRAHSKGATVLRGPTYFSFIERLGGALFEDRPWASW